MNWKQTYNATTPDERDQVVQALVEYIGKKNDRRVLANGVLIRERRRLPQRYHFINRRRGRSNLARPIYLLTFTGILGLLSTAIWLVAINIPPSYAAFLVMIYALALMSILVIKPYRLRQVFLQQQG